MTKGKGAKAPRARMARVRGKGKGMRDLEAVSETLEARVRKRTQELRKTNIELERRNRELRALAGKLAIAEHRERRRLAGMLHDHLQQLLVTARYQVELLKRRGEGELREVVGRVDELLSQSIELSRNLTAELCPPIMQTSGLGPLLQWLVQYMAAKQNLEVRLNLPPQMSPIPEEVTIQLFQCARELLSNVLKHAKVKQSELEVSAGGGLLRLRVSDNGVGFDPARLREKADAERCGLTSVRQRLNLIGGQLEIDSEPGKGSRFTLVVPIAGLRASEGPNTRSTGG